MGILYALTHQFFYGFVVFHHQSQVKSMHCVLQTYRIFLLRLQRNIAQQQQHQ
jgi:hypothetical protein